MAMDKIEKKGGKLLFFYIVIQHLISDTCAHQLGNHINFLYLHLFLEVGRE